MRTLVSKGQSDDDVFEPFLTGSDKNDWQMDCMCVCAERRSANGLAKKLDHRTL